MPDQLPAPNPRPRHKLSPQRLKCDPQDRIFGRNSFKSRAIALGSRAAARSNCRVADASNPARAPGNIPAARQSSGSWKPMLKKLPTGVSPSETVPPHNSPQSSRNGPRYRTTNPQRIIAVSFNRCGPYNRERPVRPPPRGEEDSSDPVPVSTNSAAGPDSHAPVRTQKRRSWRTGTAPYANQIEQSRQG